MPIKIDANQSATAFHINDGATLFPYAIDAQSAVGRHPMEWRDRPWTPDEASAARQQIHDRNIAEAKARGEPAPAPLATPAALSPEDQAALDAHNKAVAEAEKRLADYYKKRDEQKKIDDQVAADEALVSSIPPQPDPTVRRPLSPAQLRKQSAQLTPQEEADKKAADDRADTEAAAKKATDAQTEATRRERERQMTADKTHADTLAVSGAKPTFGV